MKVVLDHDLPKQLRLHIKGHLALTARQMGWDNLTNGRLIAAADAAQFDVLVTADKAMAGQQSHLHRRISIIQVTDSRLDCLLAVIDQLSTAIATAQCGGLQVIQVPRPLKQRRPDSV